MTRKPEVKKDPMYMLLREGKMAGFNSRKAHSEKCDLTWCDYRGLDLRGLDAAGLDFSHSYFRQADLRGVDMSTCKLEGASLNGARISGTYFHRGLSADEVTLSLLHGTRLRNIHSARNRSERLCHSRHPASRDTSTSLCVAGAGAVERRNRSVHTST